MPSRRTEDYFHDILENIALVRSFVGGMSLEQFKTDDKTIYAVVRGLAIISEASRFVPDEAKLRLSHIPWRDIWDAGNVYRHVYHALSHERIWETLHVHLEPLRLPIEAELARNSTV